MTQQEILQNLNQPIGTVKRYNALKAAQRIAFRETYGKRINPEAVEKMKDTLQFIVDNYSVAAVRSRIEEALNAAKL